MTSKKKDLVKEPKEPKEPKGEGVRFYNWCITQNCRKDATDEQKDMFKLGYTDGIPKAMPDHKVKYCIWTLEEENNLHYHYYIELTEKVSIKWLKENFNDNTLHCEPRLGTQKQAIDYVKKIGEYEDKFCTKVYPEYPWFCVGEKKTQGNRNDLDTMVDMLEDGYMPGDILRIFRGNALRHMGMLARGVEALYRLGHQNAALEGLNRQERIQEINRLNNETL